MSNYFGRINSWLTSFFNEPFIGPQYLHIYYTHATYPIREGADPCQMLHTLGSSIEHSHKVDIEELEKYIIIDKDPMKRACTSLLFRNAMLVAVTEFYDPTASHVRLADAGDLCYRVENGRRLVMLPINGLGYHVPFIVTDNPTFPTKGWNM